MLRGRSGRRAAIAAILLALGPACGHWWAPCDWRSVPATCQLEASEVRYDAGRNAVLAVAGYQVAGAPRRVRGGKQIVYPLAPGQSPIDGIAAVREHLERNARLACQWRIRTRGDCVPDQLRVPLPGCPARGRCDPLRITLPR